MSRPWGSKSIFPSEGSKTFLERYPQTRARYGSQVQFVAKKLATKNVADLENLATALYVSREQAASPKMQDRAERIHKLKPHISQEEARRALEFVDVMAKDAETLVIS